MWGLRVLFKGSAVTTITNMPHLNLHCNIRDLHAIRCIAQCPKNPHFLSVFIGPGALKGLWASFMCMQGPQVCRMSHFSFWGSNVSHQAPIWAFNALFSKANISSGLIRSRSLSLFLSLKSPCDTGWNLAGWIFESREQHATLIKGKTSKGVCF